MAEFGADTITIGGESSGAHLAVVTLLRLRDRHGVALSGANLIFGFYDLTLTPSARLFGDDRVAPRTTDLRSYVKAFVPEGDLAAPEISPLYADLNNRSEERRVGKECVSTCRSRWAPYHSKKKK